LLAQGLSAVDAARTGVYVHGRAGDDLAGLHGERGVISSDLALAVSGVIATIPRPA
jgi:NAD(P)H-hydrate epimerase